MRYGWLLLGCLTAACGGNFSNDDLEFLNALPVREELSSKLPGASAQAEAPGLRSRVDRLELPALGAPSQLYLDTRRASREFNGGVEGLLAQLELIRAVPPTERQPERRVWGPWPDTAHPGQQVRFLMERQGERFDYRLQYRPSGAGEEAWWSFLEGSFQADGGLRKGEGQLVLRLAEAKARRVDVGSLTYLDRLDITYQTRALPIRVEARLVPAPGPSTPEVRYIYRELPGGLGEMGFVLGEVDLVPGPRREQLLILSRWTQDRGGVGGVRVLGGDVPSGWDATQVECWDVSFRVTYAARSWEGLPVGDASACPDVSALGP